MWPPKKISTLPVKLPSLGPVKEAAQRAKDLSEGSTGKLRAAAGKVGDAFERAACVLKPPAQLLDTESKKSDGKAFVVDAQTGETREYDPARDTDVIFYQNGILTSEEDAKENGRALSKQTGKPVVVVYNAREGMPLDVLQSGLDKVDPFGLVHSNPATDRTSEAMYQSAKNDRPQHYVAHSQGAIIDRNALVRTHARLYREKYSEVLVRTHDPVRAHLEASRYADEKIQNVHIIAAGGASVAWPPYANVHHVNNVADPIPNLFGQNVFLDPRESVRELTGVDAPLLDAPVGQDQRDRTDVINEPKQSGGFPGHSFQEVYVDDVADKID